MNKCKTWSDKEGVWGLWGGGGRAFSSKCLRTSRTSRPLNLEDKDNEQQIKRLKGLYHLFDEQPFLLLQVKPLECLGHSLAQRGRRRTIVRAQWAFNLGFVLLASCIFLKKIEFHIKRTETDR